MGVIHRGHAMFNSVTDNDRMAEYDSALYFYNESLKIDPNYTKALNERKEVIEEKKGVIGNLERLKH